MKKKCMSIFLVLFLMLISVGQVNAIYTKLSDKQIQNAIKLGKQYKSENTSKSLLTDNNYRFNRKVGNRAYILDIQTKFFDIANLTREKARKYQEPTSQEVKSIINDNYIHIRGYTMNSDQEINSEDLHIVLKVPTKDGKMKVIQPTAEVIREDTYMYENEMHVGVVTFKFKYEDLPKPKNGKINEDITIIQITQFGEQKYTIDLSTIR